MTTERLGDKYVCKCLACITKTFNYLGATHIGVGRSRKAHQNHVNSQQYHQPPQVSTCGFFTNTTSNDKDNL